MAVCRRFGEDLWIAATTVHIGAARFTADGVFVGSPRLEIL